MDWLLSYLTNRHRYQFVEIIGTKSDLRKVEYGVPRGSLVRPGLLQFTSDLFFQSTFTTRTTITSKEYKQKEANQNIIKSSGKAVVMVSLPDQIVHVR